MGAHGPEISLMLAADGIEKSFGVNETQSGIERNPGLLGAYLDPVVDTK